jgi:hypothetical protein
MDITKNELLFFISKFSIRLKNQLIQEINPPVQYREMIF